MKAGGLSGLERIERFAGSSAGVATIGVWAAAEAIVLPVVPDVGLCLLVLAAPHQGLRLFTAVIGGAVLGTLAMAALTLQAPEAARAMLLSLPGIDADVMSSAGRTLARDGVAGFGQLGPGPPLKVYTSEWLGQGGDIAGLLVGAVLNRLSRIGPALVAFAAIGYFGRPWLRRHSRVTLASYAAFWLLVYSAYFSGWG